MEDWIPKNCKGLWRNLWNWIPFYPKVNEKMMEVGRNYFQKLYWIKSNLSFASNLGRWWNETNRSVNFGLELSQREVIRDSYWILDFYYFQWNCKSLLFPSDLFSSIQQEFGSKLTYIFLLSLNLQCNRPCRASTFMSRLFWA